ncbi:chorismate synthase [Tepidimicrobium xylanilyticum]|uniref:Chorismate synthase n=1 Tax=Tepidimicrobium xylanilyticum TaxID=1123352 RepID=A0A1H2SSP4_9FIRM|nr:chorismate synthase [Tepidimicrobium xylanilyticum]GMG96128.1 chorismate synthase [Tepidimicrobium xylanilyticum]SDW34683.1 chorismate synthase [Tepidimicrobium xylanilyticum]
MIRYLTAGESHGDGLVGIIEGIPSNLFLDAEFINGELKRRQRGYGRSNRMALEKDLVKVLSGIDRGYTTGNPISFMIENRGKNIELIEITRPRPGHGDLTGTLKYNLKGGRNVLERASARETAMRVALGATCKLLLKEFNIQIYSHIIQIGDVKISEEVYSNIKEMDLLKVDESPIRVLDKDKEKEIIEMIDKTKEKGDTLGGIIEVIAKNVPIGLGSYTHWDRKIDGKIAYGIMSIPGVKGVEFGLGFDACGKLGSQMHDEIFYDGQRYYRKTNNAGGIEAGVTNGEDIVIRAVMKPIPTLKKPLRTVDIETKEETVAQFERSDVCAVPSASIVAENILAYILANEMTLKFGGDSIEEMKDNFNNYNKLIENR